MTRRIATLAACAALLTLPGCWAAALIGAAAMAERNSVDQRRDFQEVNIERERAGLEPITWEEYKQRKPVEDDTPDI